MTNDVDSDVGRNAGNSHGQPIAGSLSIDRPDSLARKREMPLFHQLRFAFAGRLAAFYATLFVLMGVQLLFLPVWLKARGLDASLIGVALALPWWCAYGDRPRSSPAPSAPATSATCCRPAT
jgi:hypothetical protein